MSPLKETLKKDVSQKGFLFFSSHSQLPSHIPLKNLWLSPPAVLVHNSLKRLWAAQMNNCCLANFCFLSAGTYIWQKTSMMCLLREWMSHCSNYQVVSDSLRNNICTTGRGSVPCLPGVTYYQFIINILIWFLYFILYKYLNNCSVKYWCLGILCVYFFL